MVGQSGKFQAVHLAASERLNSFLVLALYVLFKVYAIRRFTHKPMKH